MAVECRDVESAEALVSIAVSSGLRESGVTSVKKRVIVGIRCSLRLEVPLGESGNVLVSQDYVRFLVGIANQKLEANSRRIDGFLQAFNFMVGSSVSSKDEHQDRGDLKKNVDGNIL